MRNSVPSEWLTREVIRGAAWIARHLASDEQPLPYRLGKGCRPSTNSHDPFAELQIFHHKKPGAPDSLLAIQYTKRYVEDFESGCRKPRGPTKELFDQMTELYPHWVGNQSWLMFGFRSRDPHRSRGGPRHSHWGIPPLQKTRGWTPPS